MHENGLEIKNKIYHVFPLKRASVVCFQISAIIFATLLCPAETKTEQKIEKGKNTKIRPDSTPGPEIPLGTQGKSPNFLKNES